MSVNRIMDFYGIREEGDRVFVRRLPKISDRRTRREATVRKATATTGRRGRLPLPTARTATRGQAASPVCETAGETR